MTTDLARWQFATTSIYHFLFVPVTIGLAFLVALLQTSWYRNDNPAFMKIINKVNEKIERLADGKKVRFLNINDKLADKEGKFLEGMSPDRLHFSAKGYQVWAEALKPLLPHN